MGLAVPMLPAWSSCNPSPGFLDHPEEQGWCILTPWGHAAWQGLGTAVAPQAARQRPAAGSWALGLSAAQGSPAATAPDADPGPPGRETHPATRVSLKPRDTGDNCSLQHLGCIQLALKGLQMVQSQR